MENLEMRLTRPLGRRGGPEHMPATRCVVAVAALWLLNGCGGPHDAAGQQPGPAIHVTRDYEELTYEEVAGRLSAANVSASRLYDEIIGLTVDARRSPEVCRFLESLWDGEPPADFDPRYLAVPMVRLGLAKMLHQCAGQENDPRYYEYVMSILEQPDESDRMRALIALGVVGSDQDVERLRSYATGSNIRMAVGAVGGLSLLDSAAADEVLKAIAADPNLAQDVRDSAANALGQ
jgi:HEAT repeat protein